MKSINEHNIMGNVGADPEVKTLDNGTVIATFSVATSERWEKDGKEVERTEWHRVEAFGNTGKIVRDYVKKGDPVFVRGKVVHQEYTDKQGVKRVATKVQLSGFDSKIVLLKNKPQEPENLTEELERAAA